MAKIAKYMTAAQLGCAVLKGRAWADPGNARIELGNITEDSGCLADVYWTREGAYQWDVELQLYALRYRRGVKS